VIVVRKVVRSLMAVMLGWLLVVFGVCLAIPLARLVVLVLTAVLCLMQPARVRRAASAWKGGKSHRRYDEIPAGPLLNSLAPRHGQSGTDKTTATPGRPSR
jgi:hypothetical protein